LVPQGGTLYKCQQLGGIVKEVVHTAGLPGTLPILDLDVKALTKAVPKAKLDGRTHRLSPPQGK
jgi:hypothetical protein